MFTHSIRSLVTLTVGALLVGTVASAQTLEPGSAGNEPVPVVLAPANGSASMDSAEPVVAAASQSASLASVPEPTPWPHSYVIGRGGLTFVTRTAPLIGAEIGVHVVPFLQAYGSFDWHRDISPDFVQDVADLVSDIVGADVNYRFPAFTALGGFKVIAPRGAIRPYGLGGFGYGRLNGTVEIEGEDVTGLLDEFGFVDRDDINFDKALFEVGGGVSISRGRLYLDIGYRFRKFLDSGEPINMSGLYTGAGVGF